MVQMIAKPKKEYQLSAGYAVKELPFAKAYTAKKMELLVSDHTPVT